MSNTGEVPSNFHKFQYIMALSQLRHLRREVSEEPDQNRRMELEYLLSLVEEELQALDRKFGYSKESSLEEKVRDLVSKVTEMKQE